jgi:hypothetical protein
MRPPAPGKSDDGRPCGRLVPHHGMPRSEPDPHGDSIPTSRAGIRHFGRLLFPREVGIRHGQRWPAEAAVATSARAWRKRWVSREIRVNRVAPGLTWAPLISATVPAERHSWGRTARPPGTARRARRCLRLALARAASCPAPECRHGWPSDPQGGSASVRPATHRLVGAVAPGEAMGALAGADGDDRTGHGVGLTVVGDNVGRTPDEERPVVAAGGDVVVGTDDVGDSFHRATPSGCRSSSHSASCSAPANASRYRQAAAPKSTSPISWGCSAR